MRQSRKKHVAIGWVGPNLDAATEHSKRWLSWRPTVSLFQHDDFLIDRLELLYQPQFGPLAKVIAADVLEASPKTEVKMTVFSFKDPWSFVEVYAALFDFAQNYTFDVEREDYFVHLTTGTHVIQICMFLLTESRLFPAYLVQTSPPKRNEKGKPGRYEIIDLGHTKYARLLYRAQLRQEKQESVSFLKYGIDTLNPQFNRLIERIEQVAITSTKPILLLGPTGSGKSRLARRIYELKVNRKQVFGEFVEVNCATIRGDGAMSALFGHVQGSFTGAHRNRKGLLKLADGGLLFLDEISELGLEEQTMLLRAVEENTFLPFGSDREERSNFQFIAGTNADLALQVEKGRFREDLLARIEHWKFTLPCLRERVEDIEPNLQYELDEYGQRTKTLASFTAEARQKFLRFAASPGARWKRNFRDLKQAVDRMATLSPTGRITVEVVDEEIERLREGWQDPVGGPGLNLLEQLIGKEKVAGLDPFRRIQLEGVIKVCLNSRSLPDAGRILFPHSRTRKKSVNDSDRLRKYLKRHGIEWHQILDLPKAGLA